MISQGAWIVVLDVHMQLLFDVYPLTYHFRNDKVINICSYVA